MENKEADKSRMDELFTFDENQCIGEKEKENFKRAKRKSTLKMVTISGLVLVVVIVLSCVLKMQITPYLVHDDIGQKENYYRIYGANSYLSVWEESYQLIGSEASSIQYRLIEGIPVYEGRLTLKSSEVKPSISGGNDTDWQKNQYEETYYLSGNKAMQFFAPELEYPTYMNDFSMLKNMGTEKRAELAISFDRDYTVKEIEKMLPHDVHLVWNWVKPVKEENRKETLKYVYLGDEISGFPMNDKVGNPLKDPVENFKENLRIATREGGENKREFTEMYEQLGGETMSEKTVKISGIVVTGRPKDLAGLEGKSFVKGASLGAVVDQY
ncbi:MAG: anti sigma factor C-terminal domain-containing protein [Anaerovorax sp.]